MPLWMKTGTINLVNGSKNVVGVGTQFLSATVPARTGQPIVIGNVLWEIENVTSNTALTLALPYTGTTANGVVYAIMTTMEGSFNDLARRAAQVMGYFQGYMDVYEALFTGTGNVTVTMPDGDVITLPAWSEMQPKSQNLSAIAAVAAAANKLVYFTSPSAAATSDLSAFGRSLIDDADATEARLTLGLGTASTSDLSAFGRSLIDDADATEARLTLGLGTASTRNVGNFPGAVKVLGEGSANPVIVGGFAPANMFDGHRFQQNGLPGDLATIMGLGYCAGEAFRLQSTVQVGAALLLGSNGAGYIMHSASGAGLWREAVFRDNRNTTVDGNGFIKAASPILHLFADRFEVNEEAEGVSAERVCKGVYQITGSEGFAKDGWYIEGPKDANGRMRFWLDYEQDEVGVITIKTTHREFVEGPVSQRNIIDGVSNGDPIDIPEGREITVRLSMKKNENTELTEDELQTVIVSENN